MSPRATVYLSVLTLVVSLSTLGLVFSMQNKLLNFQAEAGSRRSVVKQAKEACEIDDGNWESTTDVDGGDAYTCTFPEGTVVNFDSKGVIQPNPQP